MNKYLTKMKGSDNKGNALSPKLKHDMIINLTPPAENKFPIHQFKLPSSTKEYPRKNKFRFRYKIGSPWVYDINNIDNSLHSPNSNPDYDSCYVYQSFRLLSRSAKIMRALSVTPDSFRHKDVRIRKLLNFDSSPSPKESSSYDNSNSSNTDTPLSILNSSLTDSSDDNVPIAESIDENQNQTPQQSRKHRTDIKEKKHVQSRISYIMSLIDEKEGRREQNKIIKNTNGFVSNFIQSPFNRNSNGSSRIINASTLRNLSQEFDQEEHDRSHTPENVINIIPESISAIKKSHKKEKMYCYDEKTAIQKMDISIKDDDHLKVTSASSEIDIITETSSSSENESRKNRNTKRALIYNTDNEHSELDTDHSMQETSTDLDLLESGLDSIESDEAQDIESNCLKNLKIQEKNMRVSTALMDDNIEKKEDCSMKNVGNEEVSQLSSPEGSSDFCNDNATNKNRISSPDSNPDNSQDTNKAVTPENHINMLKHVLTESIKKSHKKIKHGNRKKLFETKDFGQETALDNPKISLEAACSKDYDIKNQTADISSVSNPQNFEFDRPTTPENVNSSRLLLLDFNSVKKSHKKDKRSKRTSSFIEYDDCEYNKRNNDLLHDKKYEDGNISGISCSNELKDSPAMYFKKKKKPRIISVQSSTPKKSNTFLSLGCKSIDDDFKIFTPIKKRSILLTITDHVPTKNLSQEKDDSAISKEIDCSRCITPVARFKESRENKDLISEHDVAGLKTDTNILKADTANKTSPEHKNGRSTPVNMSTMELLHNLSSIKKSHKKDKHNRSKRPTSEKKRLYIQKDGHVNFADDKNIEECTTPSLKQHCTEKETHGIMREKDIAYPQPSTSRGTDNTKDTKSAKFLNMTPPNNSNVIKLLHTTSIKKSHKKERDTKAQIKYIFMSQEHELSDDGSIFDEEDRLNSMDINDSNTEIKTM